MAAMLDAGVTPVVACLALGASDFEYYNVNGDQMAAAVAADARPRAWSSSRTSAASATNMASESPNLTGKRIDDLLRGGVATGGDASEAALVWKRSKRASGTSP